MTPLHPEPESGQRCSHMHNRSLHITPMSISIDERKRGLCDVYMIALRSIWITGSVLTSLTILRTQRLK